MNKYKSFTKIKDRFVSLLCKLISRKGAAFVTATLLLRHGFISDLTWLCVFTIILCNITGIQVVQILKKGENRL